MNILITSASRKVGLVNQFKAALKKEGGGKVITVDIDPYSPALLKADKYYLVPKSKSRTFLPEIKLICRKEKIELIVPTRDEELLLFASKRKGLPKVHVASEKTIKLCQNKKAFVRFCVKYDFKVANTYRSDELDQINYPIFARKQFGKGGQGSRKIDTKNQLKSSYTNLNNVVIQEYIKAPEYTVDLMADFKGRILSVVPRRRIKTLGGESIVGLTVDNTAIINESIRLASKLKLVGHNTIQCFLHKAQVKFIEVNPRFGGGASLSAAAGARSVQMLIKLIKNKKVKPIIGKYKKGLVMMRYSQDMFVNSNRLKT